MNLTDNFVKGRLTLGYGLNYSTNIWNEFTRDLGRYDSTSGWSPSGIDEYSNIFKNKNLGFTFNSYYRLGKTIHLGLIYQPSLLHLNNGPEFIYEHLISLEVNWRIKLFTLKSN